MNLIIEQLARRYDLPRLKPLTTWGEWRRTYPQVIGGLKRGSTCFKHASNKEVEFENTLNKYEREVGRGISCCYSICRG
jgi:hypothetical protein